MTVLLQASEFAGFSLGSSGSLDALIKAVRGAVMSFLFHFS